MRAGDEDDRTRALVENGTQSRGPPRFHATLPYQNDSVSALLGCELDDGVADVVPVQAGSHVDGDRDSFGKIPTA